jgi:hypothetical protein
MVPARIWSLKLRRIVQFEDSDTDFDEEKTMINKTSEQTNRLVRPPLLRPLLKSEKLRLQPLSCREVKFYFSIEYGSTSMEFAGTVPCFYSVS